jgi:hypothetical protein
MIVSLIVKFEAVEREKMHLIYQAVKHVDWLTWQELNAITLADPDQTFNEAELTGIVNALANINNKTMSLDTRQWTQDLLNVIRQALEK